MNAEMLESKLEEYGELMVQVAEIDEPLELHRHDTEFEDDYLVLKLSDGELTVDIDEIVASWYHYHSLEDLGLD